MTTQHGSWSGATLSEELTERFYSWELRGRGWNVWDYAVELEPPFVPFAGHYRVQPAFVVDDGRKHTFMSGLVARLRGSGGEAASSEDHSVVEDHESDPGPSPDSTPTGDSVELAVAVPSDLLQRPELAERFLTTIGHQAYPIAFELVGSSESIVLQFATHRADVSLLQNQLQAHWPEVVVSSTQTTLADRWSAAGSQPGLIVEFGLSEEFTRPLRNARGDADPLVIAAAALGGLEAGEVAVLQVIFSGARAPWAESGLRAVAGPDGKCFFRDAADMLPLAKEKFARPLFAVVVRLAARSAAGRARAIVKELALTLTTLSDPQTNELIPITNDGYPDHLHEQDLIGRTTHRSGMLLNASELASLVHLPSPAVRAPLLARVRTKTKAAPVGSSDQTTVLGTNVHGATSRPVGIAIEQRLRHMHVIGTSGTGKSTLLLNLICQDLEHGNGLAVFDPHGDLAEQVLDRVPASRASDVILIDPATTEQSVGVNLLAAHSDLEKTLLASDLVAVFKRLSTSWGDQMTSVLGNATMAFLESTDGGTLADLRHFLVDAAFRKRFLETVQDPDIVYFWEKEFPLLRGNPQAPILTRLDAFLRPKPLRRLVQQRDNCLDLAQVMNERQILVVKLAQGLIGQENAALLGALLIAKLQQIVLARQSQHQAKRHAFFAYIDEFHHFVTPSMATLLTDGRKFGLGLVLAHQELRQLWNQDRDVAAAVLAGCATRICFGVGDEDARRLADGFGSFDAKDLQNLGTGEAICRMGRAQDDFNLKTVPTPPIVEGSAERVAAAIAARQPVHEPKAPEFLPDVPVERLEPQHASEPPRAAAGRVYDRLGGLPRDRNESPSVIATGASPGRGGPQHKYLQELIKRLGEAHGYRATIEMPVLDGTGSVDVALERDGLRLAFEIGVTSPRANEVQNILKCVSAGFDHVVAISVDHKVSKAMRAAVDEALGPEAAARVHALVPDELVEFLERAKPKGTPSPEVERIRGYRVRLSMGDVGNDAGASQRRTINDIVIASMRRLKATARNQ